MRRDPLLGAGRAGPSRALPLQRLPPPCRRADGELDACSGNENFAVTQGEAKVYASSEHGRRHFCGDCGTGLFYTNEAVFPAMTDVQSATLDDPAALPPQIHVQTAERIAWMKDLDSAARSSSAIRAADNSRPVRASSPSPTSCPARVNLSRARLFTLQILFGGTQ